MLSHTASMPTPNRGKKRELITILEISKIFGSGYDTVSGGADAADTGLKGPTETTWWIIAQGTSDRTLDRHRAGCGDLVKSHKAIPSKRYF
ncbi:hypothetical protein NQ317_005015 [Molorchus minor]|uniref:Uncharacterized protein n=1 Tax=Molorchus minor TaxID=1323400 RepID=A0ABQ9K349_9CUCU|nr:hypothetical protein NQ317_005015 [Molorchus minor]